MLSLVCGQASPDRPARAGSHVKTMLLWTKSSGFEDKKFGNSNVINAPAQSGLASPILAYTFWNTLSLRLISILIILSLSLSLPVSVYTIFMGVNTGDP